MKPKSPRTEAPPACAPQAEWANRPERTNMAMLRLMSWISLCLGRPASRVVLHFIAAYFLLLAPAARRSSRNYLRRALRREPGWRDLFQHFLCFASTIHDRVYLINDRFDLFDIAVHGEASITEARAVGQGILMMGVHLGSFEVIRSIGRNDVGLRVAMVMYEENARKLNAMLAAINPAAQQNIISLGQIDSMLRVRDRLDDGSVVGILEDRTLGDDRVMPVRFLGADAPLPVGPFHLAAMLRRPVIFMVGLYLGGNRYEIYFEPLADFSQTPPAERETAVEAAIVRYAAILERYCRSAPYNWFNFFDFWRAPQEQATAGKS
jgi:predicted LPLAT superfamily acyltransferase